MACCGPASSGLPRIAKRFLEPHNARKGRPYKNGHPGLRTRLGWRGKACRAPPGRAEEPAVECTAATSRGDELVAVGELAWQRTYDCSTRSSGDEESTDLRRRDGDGAQSEVRHSL